MARLGVQQSGTSDFVVRTSVPVRMSGRLSRMIKQYESSGTSWYELVGAGTEVTNRREPRENRARTDALSALSLSINSIFYSYFVAPSLNVLMPCELPCVQKFPLPCPERDVNHHHAPARLNRGCPEAVLPFDQKCLHVAV